MKSKRHLSGMGHHMSAIGTELFGPKHEHSCMYEEDRVAHEYCRCRCGWRTGPVQHEYWGSVEESDRMKRDVWEPPS